MRILNMKARRADWFALTLLGIGTILGCGDDSTAPTTGSIQVTSSTTGTDPDPDGYTVSVDNGPGQPITDAAGVTFSDVEAGDHTVALTGVSENCTVADSPRTVSVTADATAQVSFIVTCSAPPPQAMFLAITAGETHTCGILADAGALCWGSNGSGELGTGLGNALDSVPVPVSGGLAFQTISGGTGFTCGTTTGNQAYCWGRNDQGQIGDGTEDTERPSPVAVAGGLSFSAVSAGVVGSCAIAPDDRAFCWGNNTTGQLGRAGVVGPSPLEVEGSLTFASLQIGGNHTCGVTTTGAAFCWGENGSGQLGTGAISVPIRQPTAVSGGLTFESVTVGEGGHSCGVATDGQAYCWGLNNQGQLGDGTTAQGSAPTLVAGGLSFDQLQAGSLHTCGIATDGLAYCWGTNNAGQLGDGTTDTRTTPVAVSGELTFAGISSGQLHSCGITTAGEAWCWGNGGGLLGNNSTARSLVPVEVVVP